MSPDTGVTRFTRGHYTRNSNGLDSEAVVLEGA